MVVWALLLGVALAGPEGGQVAAVAGAGAAARRAVQVVAAPVMRPDLALAPRRALVVSWDGGASRVERWNGRRWVLVEAEASSPLRTRAFPAGTTLRVVRDGKEVGRGQEDGCWWPVDVAGWSGPGLRGATVQSLDVRPGLLTVGTRGGGLAGWDGARWTHLNPRLGGVHHVSALARDGDAVWAGGDEGLVGPGVRWTEAPVDELLWAGETLWFLSEGRLGSWGEGRPDWAGPRGCAGLLLDEHGDAVVTCGGRGLVLPAMSHDRRPGAEIPLAAVALRRDGTWGAARDGRLLHISEDAAKPVWAADSGALRGIARAGDRFLIAAGADGAWVHDGRDGARLGPAAGVHGSWAGAVAPGPASSKAWLGTDRGVHLVTAGGTGTQLPLAPLAAGVAIRAVQPWPGGAVVAATDAGVHFVGRGPPKGFGLLQTAVVEPVTEIERDAAGGLWVLGREHVWRLDPKGALRVFRLDGLARAMSVVGPWVAIATEDGLRFWAQGATMLSPVQPFPRVDVLRGTTSGAMWIGAGEQLHLWIGGELRSVDLPGAVLDVLPGARGATVATTAGVLPVVVAESSLRAERRDAARPVRLAHGAGRVWTVDDALTVTGVNGLPDLTRRLGHAEVTALAGDAQGVWLGTSAGLLRIVAAPR